MSNRVSLPEPLDNPRYLPPLAICATPTLIRDWTIAVTSHSTRRRQRRQLGESQRQSARGRAICFAMNEGRWGGVVWGGFQVTTVSNLNPSSVGVGVGF